jgi:AraC-like DNA-binding protein
MSYQFEKSDQHVEIANRDVARSRTNRSRRVRLSYPSALVELALLLCGTFGAVRTTSELGIGKSTLYRWRNAYRTAWTPRYRKGVDGRPDRWSEVARELYARCERAGFPMRASVLRASVAADRVVERDASGVCADGDDRSLEFSHAYSDVIVAGTKRVSDQMMRAKNEIDRNYASKQSIAHLSHLVALPRIKFIKEFTATFGVSPYRYLLGVRFRHALALLQSSGAPLADVASATGFGTAASMQHAFKRFAGVTPAKLMNTIAPQREANIVPLARPAQTH